MKGQQDAEDPDNEQVLEWFDRLMVKLVANRDSESHPESKSSFCLPVLHAIEGDNRLLRKFLSYFQ